jgi:NlpC/P60 family putative phage cell wall peptidase
MGERVVALARGWIGTPYQHQASCKGAGADCLGLLRGVWRELHGAEPERPGPYTPDWSETDGVERLLPAARRHMVEVEVACAGDVLLFRLGRRVVKHVAILSDDTPGAEKIIHAYSGRGVVESPLTPAWARRIAGRFRIPEGRA